MTISFWPDQAAEVCDAAYRGNSLKVKIMLALNPSLINIQGVEDNTPLIYASFSGHKSIVKYLLSKGAKVNVFNKKGRTPLHNASMSGHRDIAELLIINGAYVNQKDTEGWTALVWALKNRHKSIVELLISYGADINTKDNKGRTALHWASYELPGEGMAMFLRAHGAKE